MWRKRYSYMDDGLANWAFMEKNLTFVYIIQICIIITVGKEELFFYPLDRSQGWKEKVAFYYYRTTVYGNLASEKAESVTVIKSHQSSGVSPSCLVLFIVSFYVMLSSSLQVKYFFSQDCCGKWQKPTQTGLCQKRRKREGIIGSQTENSKDNFRRGWIQVLKQCQEESSYLSLSSTFFCAGFICT